MVFQQKEDLRATSARVFSLTNAVIKLRDLEFIDACCPDRYDLTLLVQGIGTVDPAGGKFEPGTNAEIIAMAEGGWRFDHWEGDVPAGQETSPQVAIAMDGDKSLMAVFAALQPGEATPTPPGGTGDTGGTNGPGGCGGCGPGAGATMPLTLLGLLLIRWRAHSISRGRRGGR